MRILLVTSDYPPEIRSASHLMLELAEELTARGHRVTVLTARPEHNLDENREAREFREVENESGVAVVRVRGLPVHNVGYIARGIGQLTMPLTLLARLYANGLHKQDAVVVYSPPLPLAAVGSWFHLLGVPAVLNVQDLFPQNAIDLGIMKNPAAILFFRTIERFAYRTADVVTVHSEGNRDMLARRNPGLKTRLRVLHNWVDMDHHEQSSPRTDFKKKFGVERKFVVVFGGVVGPSQYLNFILELAKKATDLPELLFLLVGDGTEKARLQKTAAQMGLSNVSFQPFVSREKYPALLRIASAGLICLSPKNKTPVVPGKLLGYMAAGLPVLAFLHRESDGHAMVKSAECGYSAYSDDPEKALETLRRMYFESKAALKEMGESGRRYAEKHFSKQVIVDRLESFLNDKS